MIYSINNNDVLLQGYLDTVTQDYGSRSLRTFGEQFDPLSIITFKMMITNKQYALKIKDLFNKKIEVTFRIVDDETNI